MLHSMNRVQEFEKVHKFNNHITKNSSGLPSAPHMQALCVEYTFYFQEHKEYVSRHTHNEKIKDDYLMKHLLFILLILIPSFTYSHNKVCTPKTDEVSFNFDSLHPLSVVDLLKIVSDYAEKDLVIKTDRIEFMPLHYHCTKWQKILSDVAIEHNYSIRIQSKSIILAEKITLSQSQKKHDKYDEAVDLAAFKAKVLGTLWTYEWNGNRYIFELSKDGSVERISTWEGTTWSVTGKNEVILKRNTSTMYLFFNDQATEYSSIDWYGKKTKGKLFQP